MEAASVLTEVMAPSFPVPDVLGAWSSVDWTGGSEGAGDPVSDWYVPAREVWPECVPPASSSPPLSVTVRGGVEFGVLSGTVPADCREMYEGEPISECVPWEPLVGEWEEKESEVASDPGDVAP